jgi:Mor family transcriptional regulator
MYASVALNVGWKGGVIPIPYSHVVWFLTHGRWPKEGWHLDHKNDDAIDNRPDNLDEQTEQDNQKKRRGRRIYRSYGKGKYGYGIYIYHDKRDERYYVSRHLSRGHGNGELKTRKFSLGGFHSLSEAESVITRHIEEIKLHGLDYVPEAPTKKPKWRTVEIQARRNSVRRHRANGMTIEEIAKITGVSESNVYTLVKDMQVDLRSNKDTGYKLTAEKVLDIRKKHAGGRTCRSLGQEYGVSTAMISGIIKGRVWAHVK